MYLSKKNLSSKQLHLSHHFPVRTCWFFKGILPASQSFQVGDRLILFQIGVFRLLEETHVSVQRETFFLEADTSSTWFSCENCISFCREYFLQLWLFKVDISSV
jgi:hypothetical protein